MSLEFLCFTVEPLKAILYCTCLRRLRFKRTLFLFFTFFFGIFAFSTPTSKATLEQRVFCNWVYTELLTIRGPVFNLHTQKTRFSCICLTSSLFLFFLCFFHPSCERNMSLLSNVSSNIFKLCCISNKLFKVPSLSLSHFCLFHLRHFCLVPFSSIYTFRYTLIYNTSQCLMEIQNDLLGLKQVQLLHRPWSRTDAPPIYCISEVCHLP